MNFGLRGPIFLLLEIGFYADSDTNYVDTADRTRNQFVIEFTALRLRLVFLQMQRNTYGRPCLIRPF